MSSIIRVNAHNAAYLAGRKLVESKRVAYEDIEQYPDSFVDEYLVFENLDGSKKLRLSNSPLVSISRQKKMIISEINEGKAEVVEIISTKSFQLTIKGELVDMVDHKRPRDQIKELNNFFEVNEMVKVYYEELSNLGIDTVVINAYNMNPEKGFEDRQPYSITARSVRAPELSLFEV